MKKKRHYLHPASAQCWVEGADGLLVTFSLSHAENASEYDNPPMDTKEQPFPIEWDDKWEE